MYVFEKIYIYNIYNLHYITHKLKNVHWCKYGYVELTGGTIVSATRPYIQLQMLITYIPEHLYIYCVFI